MKRKSSGSSRTAPRQSTTSSGGRAGKSSNRSSPAPSSPAAAVGPAAAPPASPSAPTPQGRSPEPDAAPPEAPSTGPEAVLDNRLVDDAVRWIQRKVGETVNRGLAELGEYCFTTFYDRDLDLVRATNPHKHVSFRALTDRCDTVELPVSKTVLYNAISIAVINHQLPRGGAFKQLPASHQTALLPVRDPARVERLAQRVLSKELSVRQVRDIVGAEVALRDTEAPFRGRPPLPVALKSLRAATKTLRDEAGKMGWSKAQVDELSEVQAKEALKLTEGLIAALQRAAERLRER